MTYAANETSIESGRPVEVFEITAGPLPPFFYTSAEDEVTIAATTYKPVAGLQRNDTSEGPDKRNRDFEIELPTIDPLAQLFVGVLPGFRLRMTARRFHRDDLPTPEVVEFFDGFIRSASFEDDGAKTVLTARNLFASLGRQIPNRRFSAQCNFVLFDPTTCQVDDTDPANRASALTVVSQVGNVLTVAGLSPTFPDGSMNSGFVEVVGGADFRGIRSQTGNALTLMFPFRTPPATVNVFVGCDHTIAGANGCGPKFANRNRFGGFSRVPVKNPYATGLV